MNLTTNYMGFKLAHPLIPGASPMTADLDAVKRLADAGAPIILMHSLFEEQIRAEQLATAAATDVTEGFTAEATNFWPSVDSYRLGPEEYLDQIRKIKKAVNVPVVGSLNGTTLGGWLDYARQIEQAGADGLELNLYELPMDPSETSQEVETRALEVVRTLRSAVLIPIAVKLSPFYSAPANFCTQLDQIGVDAIVLFNRFYQPDIDIENLEMTRVNLSDQTELLLRLRWLAVLAGKVRASLGATGGVSGSKEAIKAIMAGAHGVQMVSSLLRHGPEYLAKVRKDMTDWMTAHEYESIAQMRGSMSLSRCPDPRALERANYIQILQSWTTS